MSMSPKESSPLSLVAFAGEERVARGTPAEVALVLKRLTDEGERRSVLVFNAVTSEPFELDLRGTEEQVLDRVPATQEPSCDDPPPEPVATPRGPGRPKLGVVSREVTLLPRHWQWLAEQPGSASVTLRRLVDAARRAEVGKVSLRRAQESAYRFISVMAGDAPGFEEANRALFAGDADRFQQEMAPWPKDVRQHAEELASAVFATSTAEEPAD